jgi:hypothetical protein
VHGPKELLHRLSDRKGKFFLNLLDSSLYSTPTVSVGCLHAWSYVDLPYWRLNQHPKLGAHLFVSKRCGDWATGSKCDPLGPPVAVSLIFGLKALTQHTDTTVTKSRPVDGRSRRCLPPALGSKRLIARFAPRVFHAPTGFSSVSASETAHRLSGLGNFWVFICARAGRARGVIAGTRRHECLPSCWKM